MMQDEIQPIRVERDGDAVRMWIKAVPGSSRNQIAGRIGSRLKIRISAPPEGGKANKAICRTLAQVLGIKANQVSIESGRTNPEKVVRIQGVAVDSVRSLAKSPRMQRP